MKSLQSLSGVVELEKIGRNTKYCIVRTKDQTCERGNEEAESTFIPTLDSE